MAQKTQKTKTTHQKTLTNKGKYQHRNTKNVLIEPKNINSSNQTNTEKPLKITTTDSLHA
jgi:hypothetical protein